MKQERVERIQKMLENRLESICIVLEAVHIRHNISAILRSAEAFGVHDVHLVSGTQTIRSSSARGAERWVQVHRHQDIEQCIEMLKKQGYQIIVADLQPGAKSPDQVAIDKPIALVMGTELTGVSDKARQLADGFVIVPMRGLTQSLNVSVACACIVYRLAERRRALVGGGDLATERQQEALQNWLQRDEKVQRGVQARQRLKESLKRLPKMPAPPSLGEDH